MENVRLSEKNGQSEKWSFKCQFNGKFQSKLNEKKYLLIYLRNFYRSSHCLLVLILIVDAILHLFQLVFIPNEFDLKSKIISIIFLFLTIILNIFSLILLNHLRNRILSKIISLICICPFIVFLCYCSSECDIYLIIILIYTLGNNSFLFSLIISIIISIILLIFTLKWKISLILLIISHLIGIYLNYLLDKIIRSSYNQLCQNVIVRCSLLTEHTLISKMIDSLMPRKYSQIIMEDFDVFRSRVEKVDILNERKEENGELRIFRPLHIERMENVSILFADIVGFTSMSSNKSATQLVSLLSDLYGRFDDLCVQMSCEKISTLGDCYYCVSGCPEPQKDHGKWCLLMGLAMINAIEEFDEDNFEDVDMRVGVHSGSVNCGIIGTRKFKFDIFSNDVTLANKMESTGKPGYVHITESTYCLVKSDEFQFEEGPPYQLEENVSMKTYFIGKRRLSHRITRKPPSMTLAKAAAVAVVSGVPLSVPLNDQKNLSDQFESTNISSPLLEEVEQARRATVSEDDMSKGQNNEGDEENVNEKMIENEEKELIIPLNILTLKYKEEKLEKDFSSNIHSPLLVLIEILLSIISSLIIFLVLSKNDLQSLIHILIFISMKMILTILFLRFNKKIFQYSLLKYLFSFYYLFSPLILVLLLISNENSSRILPIFVVYISTYLLLCTYLSHLFKMFLALISILLYFFIFIIKEQIQIPSMVEIIVCLLMSFLVLYGISREMEKRRRCHYHVVHQSTEQRIEIEKERERAEWLLRNILPSHVIEPLRQFGGSYSRNHPCVGVLFASLVNFHVMYEEQYEGGQFYARILNEFYGDIEELFLHPRFSKIEKIKTIGATYMAASGLQTDLNDQNPLESVCDLIEFALAFQSTMDRFNEALLNFAFELRMGLNFGPVTAGVIGTTKLFYDIWGDTVNVASRMDSTGQKGKIQVPEHFALALKENYQFELRGEIDVKGKSRMTTYFLIPNSNIQQ